LYIYGCLVNAHLIHPLLCGALVGVVVVVVSYIRLLFICPYICQQPFVATLFFSFFFCDKKTIATVHFLKFMFIQSRYLVINNQKPGLPAETKYSFFLACSLGPQK
jgi:hypothetical protein